MNRTRHGLDGGRLARRLAAGLLAAAALLVSAWGQGVALAQAARGEAGTGRHWALLIGVAKYHRAPALACSLNDVSQLAATLRTRAGYSSESITEITDQASNARSQPFKASIEAEVPRWLQQMAPDDSVLVYFTGHGFRDAAGKMYLAPLDCNPADLAATGIPVEWLRQQVAGCKARFKLLVLDSCHAGSEKGDEDQTRAAAELLAEPFRDLEGVFTLASSKANEKSQIWDEKQQSLFSFWLNQGMRGHADENGDGAVDVDELYKYVFRNVTQTARAHMPLPQTPVRIVRAGSPDVPVVVQLRPLTLRQVLSDVAEQTAAAMVERKLGKVGVLEFANDTKLGELLGADFGLLGRYCAEELERRLAEQGEGKFTVVDRHRLQNVLREQGFRLTDVGSPDALRQLAQRTGGMSAVALGTLRNRAGRVVYLQCKLLRTDSDEPAGFASGTAVLNESEWAMLGRSVRVATEDRRPEYTPPGKPSRPVEDQLVERMDTRAKGAHPLEDPNFPFPVKLMINGQERKGVVRGNDYYVPVRKGEVYEIWVENRSGQTVLMRLLVDGLNTLPELLVTKGVETYVVGKRVNLDEARHWELDPKVATLFAIRGFVTEVGPQGKLREFQVTDVDDSLAARQKYTDQVGMITAAFYSVPPASGSRSMTPSVGTKMGKERDEQIRLASAVQPTTLLSVVHIRYVDADTLDKQK